MRDWIIDHADGLFLGIGTTLVVLTLLMLATGCTASKPSALQPVGNAIAASEAYRATAFEHADQPRVVRWALGDDGQKRTLDDAAKSLDELGKLYQQERDKRTKLESELEAERSQWIGDRGWQWIWTIGIAWLVLGIVAVYLSAATGGASVLAGFLFKLLPLANIFTVLVPRQEKSNAS